MQLIKNKSDFVFYSAGFLLTIFYIFFLKPVYNIGDGPSYLIYAHTIIENGDTSAFIGRSPLYPWLLSILISAFGENNAIKGMIIVQFLLLYISVVLLYRILLDVFNKKFPAICIATMVMINLSCIYYSFMLLTETLALFLLMLTIWLLLLGIHRSSPIKLFLAGLALSVSILTRFNILPMLLIFLLIIILLESRKKSINFIIILRNLAIFLIPSIIILNSYAFLNYQKHGFYGLFPFRVTTLVSRNALIATIDGTEKVSREHLEVLDIFMVAEIRYKEKKPTERKGSLTRFDKLQITERLYKGFPVYSTALPQLCSYFNINPIKPEPDISKKLATFYNEIRRLNKDKVWGMRILSFFSSFRSSTGLVIPERPDINFGKLPTWIIVGYKLIVFTFSTMVLLFSIIYFTMCILKVIRPNWTIILLSLIVFGFFFINFVFATTGDANRFKYPAEPLIIALGVYYIYTGYSYIKRKIRLK